MSGEMIDRLWQGIGGAGTASDRLALTGPDHVLPSVFDVTGLAAASVGVATLAAAELLALRNGTEVAETSVDSRAACAAFVPVYQPIGWEVPPVWDPVAGDYEASDGWIRLHTNYAYHRAAVARVLGGADDRESVATQVKKWRAEELETAVVEEGGCAAVMHDRQAWRESEAGAVSVLEPLLRVSTRVVDVRDDLLLSTDPTIRPFEGVRVLDLTRVIAGPTGTRFLAGYGADVLRIDPRGFEEVPGVLPDVTAGKHCAALDLRDDTDRAAFEDLVRQADILVCGLRPDALAGLGFSHPALEELNPRLITASLNAYGWDGPWRGRRGFDSLVQMSTGIAAAGAAARGTENPTPLPVQALDFATGYLLAASLGKALVRLAEEELASDIRCSLAGTANLLIDHPVVGGLEVPPPTWSADDTEDAETWWGPMRRPPLPGTITGVTARFDVEPGPLGRHPAAWAA